MSSTSYLPFFEQRVLTFQIVRLLRLVVRFLTCLGQVMFVARLALVVRQQHEALARRRLGLGRTRPVVDQRIVLVVRLPAKEESVQLIDSRTEANIRRALRE